MIASLSDGGFRDGAKLLEEIAASAKDQTITEELIEGKYHLGTIGHFMKQFFVALYQQDLDMALSVIAQMGEQGVDFGFFIQQAIEVLHRMLLMNAGVKTEELASDFPRFNVLDIRELYELLVKAHIDMKYAVLAQMPLELAAVSWCARQEYEVERERNGTDVSDLRKKVGELKKQQALAAEAGNMMTKDSPSEVTKTSLFSYQGNGEPTHEWLATFWQALIRQMKSYNHTVSGVLRGCKVTAFTKEYLIITTAYAFHKDRLSEAKTLKALEEAVKVLTGKQMQVRIELKK
jgi:DNA polymerase III gamma/tau subunit